MDPLGFQREVDDLPEVLLYGPTEALNTAWNREVVEALDRIMPM